MNLDTNKEQNEKQSDDHQMNVSPPSDYVVASHLLERSDGSVVATMCNRNRSNDTGGRTFVKMSATFSWEDILMVPLETASWTYATLSARCLERCIGVAVSCLHSISGNRFLRNSHSCGAEWRLFVSEVKVEVATEDCALDNQDTGPEFRK
jgi:hypothetical protein